MSSANDTEINERLWREFGDWIEAQRRLTPFTQEAAAARAGMKRQQWSRIVKGTSGTKRSTVIRMAQALNADLDEALIKAGFAPTGNGKPITRDEIPPAEIANFASRVERVTPKLSPQQRRDFRVAWQMANDLLDRLEREGNQ